MACLFPGRSVALFLCMLAVGCASVDRTTNDGSEPAASPSNDGGSGEDAIEPATGDGVIVVSPLDAQSDKFTVSAAFRSKVPATNVPALGDDPCRLFEPFDPYADGDVYAGDTTAGKITVRAGSREVRLKLLGEGQKNQIYNNDSSPLEGLSPGDPIEVEATGGTVPAFRVSLELSHPLQLLTPLTDGIAKDAAFDVAWQPTPGNERVSIGLAGKGKRLFCMKGAADGSLVLPAELVRAVAAEPVTTDDGKPALELSVTILTYSKVRAGAFDITAQSSRRTEATLVLH